MKIDYQKPLDEEQQKRAQEILQKKCSQYKDYLQSDYNFRENDQNKFQNVECFNVYNKEHHLVYRQFYMKYVYYTGDDIQILIIEKLNDFGNFQADFLDSSIEQKYENFKNKLQEQDIDNFFEKNQWTLNFQKVIDQKLQLEKKLKISTFHFKLPKLSTISPFENKFQSNNNLIEIFNNRTQKSSDGQNLIGNDSQIENDINQNLKSSIDQNKNEKELQENFQKLSDDKIKLLLENDLQNEDKKDLDKSDSIQKRLEVQNKMQFNQLHQEKKNIEKIKEISSNNIQKVNEIKNIKSQIQHNNQQPNQKAQNKIQNQNISDNQSQIQIQNTNQKKIQDTQVQFLQKSNKDQDSETQAAKKKANDDKIYNKIQLNDKNILISNFGKKQRFEQNSANDIENLSDNKKQLEIIQLLLLKFNLQIDPEIIQKNIQQMDNKQCDNNIIKVFQNAFSLDGITFEQSKDICKQFLQDFKKHQSSINSNQNQSQEKNEFEQNMNKNNQKLPLKNLQEKSLQNEISTKNSISNLENKAENMHRQQIVNIESQIQKQGVKIQNNQEIDTSKSELKSLIPQNKKIINKENEQEKNQNHIENKIEEIQKNETKNLKEKKQQMQKNSNQKNNQNKHEQKNQILQQKDKEQDEKKVKQNQGKIQKYKKKNRIVRYQRINAKQQLQDDAKVQNQNSFQQKFEDFFSNPFDLKNPNLQTAIDQKDIHKILNNFEFN